MTTAVRSQVGGNGIPTRVSLATVPLSSEEVGARIARARDEKKPKAWSQLDLALAMEVSPSTIYRWEKGKLPSVNDLLRLAEVLDKPIDYLTEPPERQQTLDDLRGGLEGLQDGVDRGLEALLESLASIDARLSQIEAWLAAPSERDSRNH